ncbi:hypothetical protein WI697_19050 [Tistrella mobilis]|uniref:hypothetical protein n=1 Tax=Tistrella mobilis TaxID=171437 RepID=UPI0031F68E13
MSSQTNKNSCFSPKEIEHIGSILKEMASAKNIAYAFKGSKSLYLIEKISTIITIISTLSIIFSSFYMYISSYDSLFMRVVIIFGYPISIVSYVFYLLSTSIIILQIHRNHSSKAFLYINRDASNNIEYLKKLRGFTKPALEWYLLHYRHHWECIDKRVALRIGDLPKIGLLPALMAASVVASTLIKYESNIVLWIPMIIFCLFYIVGFFNSNNRNQNKKVIAVLEYTIAHMNDQKQHEPYSPRFINKGKYC